MLNQENNPSLLSGQVQLSRTQSIVMTALFTALVYVFTMLNVNPLGLSGTLVHLGNIPCFIAAILFGRKVGALSGGIGMALFDLLSPYAVWAPITLVTGLLMGYVMGVICERKQNYLHYILAIAAATVVKVVGYYIGEVILYGNILAPVASIPANLMQVAVAAVVVLVIIEPLRFGAKKTILAKQVA